MAAAIPSKPHLNIGVIGSNGHGKTTLTAAITMALATGGIGKNDDKIDAASEERIRGRIISSTIVEYETANRHYSHLDCPGHAAYLKNLITGDFSMHGATLVVSATDGVMPQTREQILVAKLVGVANIVVFLNKTDVADEEVLELIELEVRELPSSCGFSGDDIPIISGSALEALEAFTEDPVIKKGDNECVDKIYELMDTVDAYIPIPQRLEQLPFLLAVDDDVFSIDGRGTLVSGRIERGAIEVGENVDIMGFSETRKTSTVSRIEMLGKSVDKAVAGDKVEILLRGESDIQRGMVLAKPGSINPHTKFEAIVYMLNTEEGGRHLPFFAGYRPQFYFRTRDVTGNVITIMEGGLEMVMPGDCVKMTVELQQVIACEAGMRFAVREGGKTVGAGVIQSIIQ